MKLTPGKLAGLKAVSNERGVIAAAAMDQRGSLQKSLAKEKGGEVNDFMMQEFKILVTEVLTQHASAILLDPEWGLPAAKKRAKGSGLITQCAPSQTSAIRTSRDSRVAARRWRWKMTVRRASTLRLTTSPKTTDHSNYRPLTTKASQTVNVPPDKEDSSTGTINWNFLLIQPCRRYLNYWYRATLPWFSSRRLCILSNGLCLAFHWWSVLRMHQS